MFDVIPEIIIPLIAAAGIGLLTGWLLWSWRSQRVSPQTWTDMSERVDTADAEIATVTAERDNLESRVEVLADAIDGSTTRIAALTGELETSHRDMAELKAQDRDVEDQLTTLQTELDLAKQRINALRAEVVDRNQDIADLDEELEAYADLKGLRLDLNDAKATVISLRTDREEARTQVAELKATLIEREARIMELVASPSYSTDLFSPTPTGQVPIVGQPAQEPVER